MTATIPSLSLVSHSVFPFCPLYPSAFCLVPIIFHNLFSANISHLLSSPLSLNWNDVFFSCSSVSNLNRMFFGLTASLSSPSLASAFLQCFPRFFSHAFLSFFSLLLLFHGLGIKRRSLISVPLFSLLLQPVSCLLGCFRYMVVWALVWTSAASVRADSWIPLGESVREWEGGKTCERACLHEVGGGTERGEERREEKGESSGRREG